MVRNEPALDKLLKEVDPEDLQTGSSDDGVDVSLIRWMLSLSPAERLQALQQRVNSILRFQARNNSSTVVSDAP